MSDSILSNRERRAQRMAAVVSENQIVSDRTYNLVMGGVVLYGLVANAILCAVGGAKIFYAISAISPFLFLLLYLALAFGGTYIANKSDKPLISFLGYNMVVLPIGVLVSAYVEPYSGSTIVLQAIYYTALVTAIMILASILFPQVFSKLGGFLAASLCGILLIGFISMFFGGFQSNAYSLIVAIIFALYIGYDFYRSQQFPKTIDNAVDCALDIYLDIINLFIRILRILGSKGSRRK